MSLRLTRPTPDLVVPRQAAGENFPVALGILPAGLRRDLLAVYRFSRYIDDLGDAADGDRLALLRSAAAEIEQMYAGQPVGSPPIGGMAATVSGHRIPQQTLLRLVRANEIDQSQTRYETFDELLHYCTLSANPVGEMVLHILDSATPPQIQLSDMVCTGLQLVEHWQDVAEDYREGRIYLPATDMRRFGVSEVDLKAPAAPPGLRALIGFETDRALAYINAGAPLVSTLRGWGRLAVSGYIAGGRAAAAVLRRSEYDPLPAPPKPGKRDIAAQFVIGKLRWPG